MQQDLRFALRTMGRSPGATAVAVLSIALGVGANTLVFSLAHGLLLRRLPFREPERLVALQTANPSNAFHSSLLTYREYAALRQSRVFSGTAAYLTGFGVTLESRNGPERVEVELVTADLLPLLGVEPILGRTFRPEDDHLEARRTILLGYDLWRQSFAGDPEIVGRTILANSEPYEVIGVMPPGFRFPDTRDAWVPLMTRLTPSYQRTSRDLEVAARLRPGVTLEQARAEIAALSRRLAAKHPDTSAGWSADVVPLRQELTSEQAQPLRQVIPVMMGAAAFVLTIACANVANLLLARAAGRRREMAVRAAFGAGRGRIVRQLLTESLLLALTGGALGVGAAFWGVGLVREALSPLPYWMRLTVDIPALLFTLGATVAAGLLFGLVPALRAARVDLHEALKDGARSAGSLAQTRLRAAVILAEVTVSVVLLIGASLFVRSLVELTRSDGGIQPERLLTLWIYLPGEAYRESEDRMRRVEDVLRRLQGVPGVESAAAANTAPLVMLSGGGPVRVAAEGRRRGNEGPFYFYGVTAGFFRTLGARIVSGRELTAREGSTLSTAALVNESLAKRLWPGSDPVGRRFRIEGMDHGDPFTVVGVVADIWHDRLRLAAEPALYLPYPHNYQRPAAILVRTQGPPEEWLPRVRRVVRASDPGLPVFKVATMEQARSDDIAVDRLFSQIFALFGAIAVFLAAVGVYGVLSYGVSQRHREIGIRLALGARRWDVLRLVVGQGVLLTLTGVAAGVLAARGLTGLVAGLLYQVSPTDPVSFVGVPILLADVAFIACYLPARRALDVEPREVLRDE
ncbi:MAG TPA: ABC transporter permease [Thermoanaerobaculia bacterium]